MSRPGIAPVEARRDLASFVALPYELHRHDPGWTPVLRRDVRALLSPARNPYWEHASRQLFLARDGGRVVGRLAAIEDRLHLQRHGDGAGFFGFFESEEDAPTASALLDAAAGWLRGRGLRAIRGPFNPSINDEAGLLVDGFDTPSVLMMPHNPAYYRALFQAACRGVVPLLGSGEQELTLVHVRDLAEALVLAASWEATLGRAYHAGHETPVTQRRLAAAVGAAVGRRVRCVRLPGPVVGGALGAAGIVSRLLGGAPLLDGDKARELLAPGWVCSSAALRRDAGWEAGTSLEERLAGTARAYRDAGWL